MCVSAEESSRGILNNVSRFSHGAGVHEALGTLTANLFDLLPSEIHKLIFKF